MEITNEGRVYFKISRISFMEMDLCGRKDTSSVFLETKNPDWY